MDTSGTSLEDLTEQARIASLQHGYAAVVSHIGFMASSSTLSVVGDRVPIFPRYRGGKFQAVYLQFHRGNPLT